MRYSVHPPRTFRNRIAKSLGVLVGAALVATFGLPSAAQAQTPAAPTITGTGDGTAGSDGSLLVEWGAGGLPTQEGWEVEYTEPGVDWDDALTEALGKDKRSLKLTANDPRIHHGVWRVRVSYTKKDDKVFVRLGTASAITDYQHGPPTTAPTGLTAYDAGPDARRIVWDAMDALTYESRYTADPDDDDEWTKWTAATSGDTVTKLKMGTEYTFEVRGLGATRAGVGNLHGPSASTAAMMPVPTPTLPEIAALFLAMLLLGSGAYLLRRRQSGGLTPA